MSKFYGLLTQATGISADAKAPNFQAGSEGGMTALVRGARAAPTRSSPPGPSTACRPRACAKAVLDNDQLGALRRYVREDPIDESTALMDDILEVGIGGHFLGRKSTRALLPHGGLAAAGVPARHVRGAPGARTGADRRGRPARSTTSSPTHEVAPLAEDADRARSPRSWRVTKPRAP